MRVTIILLTAAVALVGLTRSGGARAAPPAAPSPVAPLMAAAALPQPQSDKSAVGTLEQVDTPSQQITVATTTTAKLVFHVVQGATIRQGSKTLKPAELAAHKGERVKVRYRESGSDRRADWIVLAAPARRVPKAPKA